MSDAEVLMERFIETPQAATDRRLGTFAISLWGLLWLHHKVGNSRNTDVKRLVPCDAFAEKVT